MLISSRKRFIFFHVPKVAGSSINAALRRYADIPYERIYNYLFDFLGQQPKLGIFSRHIKPRELRELISHEKFYGFYKFAFVRNPWDWHVSQYSYHRQNKNALFHELFSDMSFDQFIEWSVRNKEASNNCQKSFLSDDRGNLLVDFVGQVESLNEDLAVIGSRLGVKLELPSRNKSTHECYRSFYSDSARDLIAQEFREDIEFFGYSF